MGQWGIEETNHLGEQCEMMNMLGNYYTLCQTIDSRLKRDWKLIWYRNIEY